MMAAEIVTDTFSDVLTKHGITGVMLLAFLYGLYLILLKAVPKMITDLQTQIKEEKEESKLERARTEDMRKEGISAAKEMFAQFREALDKRDTRDETNQTKNVAAWGRSTDILERLSDQLNVLVERTEKCLSCDNNKPKK